MGYTYQDNLIAIAVHNNLGGPVFPIRRQLEDLLRSDD